MKTSVVIATRNRKDFLSKCLESVLAQSMERGEHEIIVVDNGSTDGTLDMVRAVENRERGFLRLIREPTPGLSPARNAGARASRGDVLAFIDDDAVAAADWLSHLTDAFERYSPPPVIVGGKIIPDWEDRAPDWLPEELHAMLYGRDHGDAPLRILSPETVTEVNFAIKRAFLGRTGWFFTGLGRKPGSLISCDGDELLMRAWSEERAVWFEPKAIVYHHVSASRLTKKFIYERSFWQGISDAFLRRLWPRSRGSRRLRDYLSALADVPGAVGACDAKARVLRRTRILAMAGRLYADSRMREGAFRLRLTGEKKWPVKCAIRAGTDTAE